MIVGLRKHSLGSAQQRYDPFFQALGLQDGRVISESKVPAREGIFRINHPKGHFHLIFVYLLPKQIRSMLGHF